MLTVAQLYKKDVKPGFVGIEIETELNSVPVVSALPANWSMKIDGSLRNGREFVTRSPIRRSTAVIRKQLDSLIAVVKPCAIVGAPTASTHIHLNALGMRPLHVANAATIWWLLEPYVLDDCGDERKSNRYARQFTFDPELRRCFTTFCFNGDNRYRAFNPLSLDEHGSIEYRAMRSSLDPEALTKWINLLCRLQYDVSPVFKSPMQVLDSFISSRNKKDFVNNLVGGFVTTSLTDRHIDEIEDRAVELYEFAWLPGAGSSWQAWEAGLKPPETEDVVSSVFVVGDGL